MSQTNTAHQKARSLEALLATLAFSSSALGLLVFAYLGYVGFVLGIGTIWISFQKQTGRAGHIWYRTFSVVAIIIALVDIAATYFSR